MPEIVTQPDLTAQPLFAASTYGAAEDWEMLALVLIVWMERRFESGVEMELT